MNDDQVGQLIHDMNDIAAEHGSLRALMDIAAELRVLNEMALAVLLADQSLGSEEEIELIKRLDTIRGRMGSSCPPDVAEPYKEEVIDLSLSPREVGH